MNDIRLRKFVEHYRARNYSASTLATYTSALKRFFVFLKGKRPDHATVRHVEGFLMSVRTLQPASRVGIQCALKAYFKMLVGSGIIMASPVEGLRFPKVRNCRKPKTLSPEEVERMMAIPDVRKPVGLRNRTMLEVLYATAVRRQELLNLSVYDVDPQEGFIWVRKGKGGRDRKAPLGQAALEWIKRYLAVARPMLDKDQRSPTLFLGARRGYVARNALRDIINACAKAARIKRTVTAHMFRHTAATEMLRNGAALRHIQELLGHARLRTTQVYTRIVPSGLADMIVKCHPSSRTRARTPKWVGRTRKRR